MIFCPGEHILILKDLGYEMETSSYEHVKSVRTDPCLQSPKNVTDYLGIKEN